LRDAIGDFRTTKLVCRSGHTSAFADLALVNVEGARSIVVIGGNDASVVKTLLALRHLGTQPDVPIVAELVGEDAAISIRALFDQQVVIVNSDAVVAELTAQACRQRSLSQVFRELLDFDGDEIYFEVFPELVGTSFGAAHLLFETGSLLGLVTPDGDVVLNPPSDRVLAVGDELTSLMMAQLSEHSALDRVFRILFDRGGSTIQMVPATHYGVTTRTGTFAAPR